MKAKEILEKNGLSVTQSRMEVLHFFCRSGKAYSMAALLAQVKNSNRITLYRTLKSFIQKKIIVAVPSEENHQLYFMPPHSDQQDPVDHCNTFFICKRCKQTISLKTNIAPVLPLSNHFIVDDEKLLLSGICPDCQLLHSHDQMPCNTSSTIRQHHF